jgi:hypothetical protein
MSADYLFFPLVESPLSSCTPVCVCVCGCIHETPFFLARLSGFNSSAKGSLVDASWSDFPGLKVKQIYTYSSFLTVWWH